MLKRKEKPWVFGEGPADGLDDTITTAEAKCSTNVCKPRNFFLSLQYNESKILC